MQSSAAHNVINERKKYIYESQKISLSRWLSSSVDNSTEPLGRKKKTKKIVFFNVYKLDARGDDEWSHAMCAAGSLAQSVVDEKLTKP